jgi:hypothetical protein
MRPALLEARVLSAVEAIRAGVPPEDDFLECKRTWPDPTAKARQFAGLLNRAAGRDVVMIVGLDDVDGTVTSPGETDPADWWAGMQSRFDETPPDLTRHMTVALGEGEYVVALAFDTTRAPFVVKNATGQGPEREVPMRDGSSTRSAYRREIVRLLLPWVKTPSAVLLDASVVVIWSAAVPAKVSTPSGIEQPAQPERVEAYGTMDLFLEHLGPEFVMLPAHGMRVALEAVGYRLPGEAFVYRPGKDTPPSRHGVEMRADGVLANGPGYIHVDISVGIPLGEAERFERASDVSLRLSLDVTGSESPLVVPATIPRIELVPFDTSRPLNRTIARFHWAAEAWSHREAKSGD